MKKYLKGKKYIIIMESEWQIAKKTQSFCYTFTSTYFLQ